MFAVELLEPPEHTLAQQDMAVEAKDRLAAAPRERRDREARTCRPACGARTYRPRPGPLDEGAGRLTAEVIDDQDLDALPCPGRAGGPGW